MTDSPENANQTKRPASGFAARLSDPNVTAPDRPRAVRIRQSRLFLLVVLVLSAIIAVIWIRSQTSGNNIEISVQSVSGTTSSAIEMTGAKYSGTTSSGQRYIITADRAVEKIDGSSQIELFSPTGELVSLDSERIRLRSNSALFKREDGFLDLHGDVVIYQSRDDVTLKTEAAQADMDTGQFSSDTDVKLSSPKFTLTSNSMRARDNGNYFLFTGQTKLIVKQTGTQ